MVRQAWRTRLSIELFGCLCFALGARVAVAQEETDDLDAFGAEGVAVSAPSEGSLSTRKLSQSPLARSLAEELLHMPGTSVTRTGGIGAPAFVGIRGGTALQTSFVIEDIVLAHADGSPVDVSMLPSELFSSVEVFRGGSTLLHLSPMGGVVRLRMLEEASLRGLRVQSQLRAGSFGEWSGGASLQLGTARTILGARASVTRSDSNYPFLSDNGTRLLLDDDRELSRANAAFLHGSVAIAASHRFATGRLLVLALGSSRLSGIPGRGYQQSEQAQRRDTQGILGLSYRVDGDSVSWSASAGYSGYRRGVSDALGEVALGRTYSDDTLHSGNVSMRAHIAVTRSFEVSVAGGVDAASADFQDAIRSVTPGGWKRSFSASIGSRLHGRIGSKRVSLQGQFRLENAGYGHDDTEQEYVLAHGRARATLGVGHTNWHVGFSTGARTPTLLELWGDSAGLLPSTSLEPERSLGGEAGGEVRLQAGRLAFRSEATFFVRRSRDLIRYRTTSQHTAKAENRASAWLYGMDGEASLSWRERVRVQGMLSWLRTQDVSGLELPLAPELRGSAELEVRSSRILQLKAVFLNTSVHGRSGFYTDPANLVSLPTRAWWNVAVGAELGAARLSFAVHDVLDARGDDFLGQPLPGRRFVFAAQMQTN